MSVTALVVDDSIASQKVVAHYLRRAGCEVVATAGDAMHAFELFRQHRPDVVTLDLMMPRFNNLDSMGLLRAMRSEMPRVAIIVVSAIPFEKTRNQYLEEGILAYVVKPLTERSFEPARIKLTQLHPELAFAQPPR